MSWSERLRPAAYVSPGGVRIAFNYENVSHEFERRTTAREFPDADGTFVDDLGTTGRRYPIRAIFWGADCDIEADAFEAALSERGVGVLEHPLYGPADVVPFGPVRRRDDLKTAGNQAIVELTFFETIGLIYPTGQVDPGAEALAAVDAYNEAAAGQFAGVVALDSAVERASFKARYTALLDRAADGLGAAADAQAAAQKQFDNALASINRGIDILIGDPLALAFQTSIMLQAPARASAAIRDRLDAYGNLARSIFGGNTAVLEPGLDAQARNSFAGSDVFALGAVAGSVVAVINTEFETRGDAVAAAAEILELLDGVTKWREDNAASLDVVDTGGAYQRAQDAVAIAAGYLVQISFDLKQERVIVLDRARTVIDLAAELYGEVDSRLDFLIKSNDLTGSEILELPRGRAIAYYV